MYPRVSLNRLPFYGWLLVLCLSLYTGEVSAANSNKVSVTPRPAWVKPVSLAGESTIKAEQASDGYLLLLRDVQIHFGQQTNYYHFIRKIHSDVGVQNGSEIEFTYDPSYQKLVFHEVKIIREGKSFNRLDASKFKVFQRETSKESYLYDESLTALLILEDVRAGDLIEYSFSCVGRNPIYKQKNFTSFYLQDYDPLDRLFMRVISPVSQKLNITYHNTHTQPQVSTENGHVVYEWDLQHIPGLAVDAEVPSGFDPYPRVWLSEYYSWFPSPGKLFLRFQYSLSPYR